MDKSAEIEMENIAIKAKLEEALSELETVKNDVNQLQEDKCDLEIMIAENDVYSQALQEHIDELECVCTTLMKQRDEQHHYFSQRELSLNCKNAQKVENISKEKSSVVAEYSSLKTDYQLLSDELAHLEAQRNSWLLEKSKLMTKIEEQERQVKVLEKELALEKQSIDDLTASNAHLAQTALNNESQSLPENYLNRLNTPELMSNLEDIVKKYEDLRTKTMHEETDKRILEMREKINSATSRLDVEMKDNRELRSKVQQLTIELEKTKQNANQGVLLSMNSSRCLKNLSTVVTARHTCNGSLLLFPTGHQHHDRSLPNSGRVPPAEHLALTASNLPDFASSSTSRKIAAANENALKKMRSLAMI